MANIKVTLSGEGELVIPKEIREELQLEAGQELTIETIAGGILLRPKRAKKKLRLEDLRGFLKYDGPPISTEELCKPVELREEES